MAITFPDSLDTFADRAAGQKIRAAHLNDVQSVLAELENLLVGRPWLNVRAKGVLGDGTDETTKIESAYAEGLNLWFPPTEDAYAIDGAVGPSVQGQVTFGTGRYSKIQQMQTGENVIEVAAALTNTAFRDLHLVCADTSSPYTSGAGVMAHAGANETILHHLLVSRHRGPGLMLNSASDGALINNWFEDSLVDDADTHLQATFDIYLAGSAQRNLVTFNRCYSGQGVGIAVQTLVTDDDASWNRIIENFIRNARQYGIMAYRNDQSSPVGQILYHTLILGNAIDTVTGAVEHATDGDVYGAGIYVQGAEFTRVAANDVANTHSANASTVTDQLAPGAIGVVNCSIFDVDDNTVRNAGKDGIHVSIGAALHNTNGVAGVRRNKVFDWGRDAFRTIGLSNIAHEDNAAVNLSKTAGSFGFRYLNAGSSTTYRTGVAYRRNTVRRSINSAYQFDYLDRARIEDNTAYQPAVHGFTLLHVKNSEVLRNTAENAKARNFTSTTDAASNHYDGNHSIGTSTGEDFADGTSAAASSIAWKFDGANERFGYNTSDGVGTKTITVPSLTANDATPSVRGLSAAKTANASETTITALDDMEEGQVFWLLIDDANTRVDFSGSSLKGNGGTDFTAASGDAVRFEKRNGVVYGTVFEA
ncbi:MAG: hypothetical protein AB7Q01_08650 [Gammaproteobacteria bacterium]